MKSKLVKIYQMKKGGQIFINATGINKEGDFYSKSPASDFGRCLCSSATNGEIGKAVKEVLTNCD